MYYPVQLDLRGRRVLVVGGGTVAARKIRDLRRAGARIDVVASRFSSALRRARGVRRIRREFRDSDLRGAFLAVAATDDARLNSRIRRLCDRRKILVNVVDRPELCSFLAPSVLTRGPLVVAVSTNGTAPGLAATLRRELESFYPRDLGRLIRLIAARRRSLRRLLGDAPSRMRAARRISSAEILRLFRRSGIGAVRRLLDRRRTER